jgi:two-component system, NtrC family, response regulator AtoC
MTNLRVLHVENDALVARAVARVLNRRGFTTASVDSCSDARTLEGAFDVGVFDVDLGDGNGVGLAEELLQHGKVTSAVFFTGTVDGELLRRAATSGGVIRKPEGVDALMTELEILKRTSPGPRRAMPVSGYPAPNLEQGSIEAATRRAG